MSDEGQVESTPEEEGQVDNPQSDEGKTPAFSEEQMQVLRSHDGRRAKEVKDMISDGFASLREEMQVQQYQAPAQPQAQATGSLVDQKNEQLYSRLLEGDVICA